MVSSRESILTKLRESVGRSAVKDQGNSSEKLEKPQSLRSDSAVRPTIGGDVVERFILKVQASGASVTRVRARGEVPAAVSTFLGENNLHDSIVVSDEAVLQGLHWPENVSVDCRAANESDKTSVTGAVFAVAESGSVVISSGRTAPNSMAFLPDNHISVVMTSQLVSNLDDVLKNFGGDKESESMPRALSFVTGPSKTADVEQTLQHGAHGPKRKHIILVDRDTVE